ncbi:hypothetical protein EIN_150880 [Entamoeba invadens IP1]|uniref:Uncharacterized protein n=1 Tax=Entamoeba invadens IP1 TaxID=370355 RepID=A0A0A1UEG1_ENTIV|nr:hypothetical protein EIN_150880 [Entamoeba invadens IP1]ELP91211.1 hypothetical protein EIN_150880 [Entamoeba invadens IP1]|eukprot:XP_004257982.1 hypothetical protein EIN_150880 [Entamoeba invadens IP1]
MAQQQTFCKYGKYKQNIKTKDGYYGWMIINVPLNIIDYVKLENKSLLNVVKSVFTYYPTKNTFDNEEENFKCLVACKRVPGKVTKEEGIEVIDMSLSDIMSSMTHEFVTLDTKFSVDMSNYKISKLNNDKYTISETENIDIENIEKETNAMGVLYIIELDTAVVQDMTHVSSINGSKIAAMRRNGEIEKSDVRRTRLSKNTPPPPTKEPKEIDLSYSATFRYLE